MYKLSQDYQLLRILLNSGNEIVCFFDEEVCKGKVIDNKRYYFSSRKLCYSDFSVDCSDSSFSETMSQDNVRFIAPANYTANSRELTTHQRGVILRGICNGAVLKDKNPQISDNNTVITCDTPLSIWDICSISCDAEAFGMKVNFHHEGHNKIIFSSKEEPKPQDIKAYYIDYLYREVFLLDEDIEIVPESGAADNSCSLIADKPYIKKQFEDISFKNLKDTVCKLCDNPEIKTRHDAIMYIVWMAALSIKEETYKANVQEGINS